MTGVGIGRFARRKAAKAVNEALSNPNPSPPSARNNVSIATTIGHSGEEGVWTNTNDPVDNDFSFSELHNSATIGAKEVEMSFEKAPFPGDSFVTRESDMRFDEASLTSTEFGIGKDVSVAATTSVSNGVSTMNSSGLSRFAKKKATPTTDANKTKNGDRICNDEHTTKTSKIAETSNHAEENEVEMNRSGCNNVDNARQTNEEDNDVVMDIPGCNNYDHDRKTNESPAQSQMPSSPLANTKNQSPVAMELDDVPRDQFNKEREKSKRGSFEKSSPKPKVSFPGLEPEKDQLLPDQTKQHQYANQHQDQSSSNVGGTVPNIIPGSRSNANDPPRTPNEIPMNARGTKESLQHQQQQQEKQNGRQPFRRETFANVTDNRVTRKKFSFAAAITPDLSKTGDNHRQITNNETHTVRPPLFANRENVLEMQAKVVGPNTASAVTTSQKATTDFRETDDRRKGTDDKRDNLDNFEDNQAKFLTNTRETEDLQERIEMNLLDMNDRFSEHYALLLRDLDVAVDLVDKLEGIDKIANDILLRHQHPTSTPNDATVAETVRESDTSGGESKSDP